MDDDIENNNGMPSPQPKKFSRTALNYLYNKLEAIQERDEPTIQDMKSVNEVIKKLNELEAGSPLRTRIGNANETILDAKIVNSASNLTYKYVGSVSLVENNFEDMEFVSKIVEAIKDPESDDFNPEDIQQLISFANEIILDVPDFAPLLGAYDATKVPEKKKPREQKIKQAAKPATKKQLIKVVNTDGDEEDGIDEIINFMTEVLLSSYEQNGRRPIDYYRYVVDTEDFGQTVENIFYTAFLVRDGKALLDVDSSGHATIRPMKKKQLQKFREENRVNTQIINSITMDMWQKYSTAQGYLQQHRTS